MRKPIIVGNWKMNKTIAEAIEFIDAMDNNLNDKATYGIAAPFLALEKSVSKAKNLIVAAQNCHFEDAGAFTGEVAVDMLGEVGVKWCIIGHSERRQLFHETDATVNRKIKAALKHGLVPIFCIGETLEEREAGKVDAIIASQLQGGLAEITAPEVANMLIAYEPVWAISTFGGGKLCKPADAAKMFDVIRDEIKVMFGANAKKVKILYGGSVDSDNVTSYARTTKADGFLVGGASLNVYSFRDILDKMELLR